MIYSLHGKILETAPNFVVIECGGVGYACRTTQTTLSVIGAVGEETTLYTHMAIHDTVIELFGFATKEELHCFQMLITVSGIGGKAGLAILSDLTPNRFALLVASGDSSALMKIKGIGKKSAERIILDLKDKLAKTNPVLQEMPAIANINNKADNFAEAMAGLLVLGYRQEEVMPILVKQDENLSAEELIKFALREMGRQAK
ncbi:MAG: Holliday junction branch migration protein RuvA [Oscillospiraceae bacterium]|nr:Holliday junction branch migration protein RuvA [Oscillospiraceae bacterium]